jgi:hypothetical protein
MLKHIEDDGDLALLVNDEGAFLFVCQLCKRQWLLQTPGTGDVLPDLGLRDVRRSIIDAVQANPGVLAHPPISLDDLR